MHFPGQGVDLCLPLGRYATVFQVEVYAILSCLKSELLEGITGQNMIICSDSQAALKALLAPRVSSRLVAECLAELQKVVGQNRLQLLWVPAHSGFLGNEEADRLA